MKPSPMANSVSSTGSPRYEKRNETTEAGRRCAGGVGSSGGRSSVPRKACFASARRDDWADARRRAGAPRRCGQAVDDARSSRRRGGRSGGSRRATAARRMRRRSRRPAPRAPARADAAGGAAAAPRLERGLQAPASAASRRARRARSAHVRGPYASLSRSSARAVRDLTVPSRTPSTDGGLLFGQLEQVAAGEDLARLAGQLARARRAARGARSASRTASSGEGAASPEDASPAARRARRSRRPVERARLRASFATICRSHGRSGSPARKRPSARHALTIPSWAASWASAALRVMT